MEITLKKPIPVLGKQGETVTVGRRLGIGLIQRGQAKKATKKAVKKTQSLDDLTVKELQEIAKDKGVSYGGLRKSDLIKELKDEIDTKEEKSEYLTK